MTVGSRTQTAVLASESSDGFTCLKDVAADYQRLAALQKKHSSRRLLVEDTEDSSSPEDEEETQQEQPSWGEILTQQQERAHDSASNKSCHQAAEGSPQHFLNQFLQQQGYTDRHLPPLTTTLQVPEYATAPTRQQLSSFGSYTQQVVRQSESTNDNDVTALRDLLHCGLSPNACNKFGESILHLACRHGNVPALRLLLQEYGADGQVADDYGRTLLHDACWCAGATPGLFDVVHLLLTTVDAQMLFCKDERGFFPLDYVPKRNYEVWNEWLEEHLGEIFPTISPEQDDSLSSGSHHKFWQTTPHIHPPHRKLLSLELMEMVANGKLTPQEATELQKEDEGFEDDTYCDTECAYYDSNDDHDLEEESSIFDDDDDDSSYLEDEDDVEILEILRVASVARSKSSTRFSLTNIKPLSEQDLHESIIEEDEEEEEEDGEEGEGNDENRDLTLDSSGEGTSEAPEEQDNTTSEDSHCPERYFL
mmetsp:Transcript_2087/g.5108  ORF Transcript_2087/g.5108 Transcript_2087/m.5108 type:complete len:479 (+) Transcript_2087:384-1820(+)